MKVVPCFLPVGLLLAEQLSQSWCEQISLLLHPPLALNSGCSQPWLLCQSAAQESFKGLEEDAVRSLA